MKKTLAALAVIVLAVPFAASASDLPQSSGTQAAPAVERADTGKAALAPTSEQKAPAAAKTAETKAPGSVATPAGTAMTAPVAQPAKAAQPEQAKTGNGQVEGKQADKVPVVK